MKTQKSRKQNPHSLEKRLFSKNRGSSLASQPAKEQQRVMHQCRAHGDCLAQSFSHQAAIGAGCPGLENKIKSYWNYFVYKMPHTKVWESSLRSNRLVTGPYPTLATVEPWFSSESINHIQVLCSSDHWKNPHIFCLSFLVSQRDRHP